MLTVKQQIIIGLICMIEPWLLMGTTWLIIKIRGFIRKEEE